MYFPSSTPAGDYIGRAARTDAGLAIPNRDTEQAGIELLGPDLRQPLQHIVGVIVRSAADGQPLMGSEDDVVGILAEFFKPSRPVAARVDDTLAQELFLVAG